jgi:hypothetical protein
MLPKRAAVADYGGLLNDYSPVVDSSTDRTAAGTNPAYTDVAAMTRTAIRTWAQLIVLAAGTAPTLVANWELWTNGNNAAPVVTRSSAGVLVLTYPVTVEDEIPATRPGFTGFVPVSFLGGFGNDRGGTTWNAIKVIPTSANVLTVYFWKFSGGVPTLGDPASDTTIDVFGV